MHIKPLVTQLHNNALLCVLVCAPTLVLAILCAFVCSLPRTPPLYPKLLGESIEITPGVLRTPSVQPGLSNRAFNRPSIYQSFLPQCICAFIWAHLCSLPCICAFMCACLGALHKCAPHLRFSVFLTIFWQSRKLHVATRALLLTLSSDRFDVSIVRFAVSRDRFSV